MKITATLSGAFLDGACSSDFNTDWPLLNESEKENILRFTTDLLAGNPLIGKNTPSWVNDNYEKNIWQ